MISNLLSLFTMMDRNRGGRGGGGMKAAVPYEGNCFVEKSNV